jgi:2',3'-cyclic-nucleotide 2'-phosphodiesterase (5'-nucleotidase family)
MREKAEANGRDLLVIDTGDRIEGNGLYDASDPKGAYSFNIVKQQHIDVITVGNHELYKKNSSENEYLVTVPDFKDNYIASNLDIFDPKTGERVPLAPRFRKFSTKVQGIHIMAFGFLFDFYGNYNNTVVQPVKDTIQEEWFQDAIRDRDIDLFLVAGHVPVKSEEYTAIFKAIRQTQWDTPIQFFGGHTHIRDYAKYDSKSYALESGRFMETIGFQSISGLSTGKEYFHTGKSMEFSRKYIDNNLFSFHHHSGHNATTFPTELGRNVSAMIKDARKSLNLDSTFGCVPKDLWMTRAKYPSNSSIFTWIETEVMPSVIHDKSRENKTAMAIINTGGIRFDLFKGPFTVDTTYIVSPFTSGFRYIKDVPYEKASKLIQILNSQNQYFTEDAQEYVNSDLAPSVQRHILEDIIGDEDYDAAFQHVNPSFADQIPLSPSEYGDYDEKDPKIPLIPGYTTTDDAGSDGDDTLHSKISFYRVPNCVQAIIPPTSNGTIHSSDDDREDPEVVDVVYIDFIEPWIVLAGKFAGLDIEPQDTDVYMEGRSWTMMIQEWVKENWECEE